MDCSDAGELIVPYLRSALEGDEVAALERHIAACRDCSRVTAEEMLADLAHAVPRFDPPRGVKDRLFDRVESVKSSRRVVPALGNWASGQVRRFRQKVSLGLAGGVAVALVAVLLVSGIWFNGRLTEISRDAEQLSDQLALAP